MRRDLALHGGTLNRVFRVLGPGFRPSQTAVGVLASVPHRGSRALPTGLPRAASIVLAGRALVGAAQR
jgi:hypothetical protein